MAEPGLQEVAKVVAKEQSITGGNEAKRIALGERLTSVAQREGTRAFLKHVSRPGFDQSGTVDGRRMTDSLTANIQDIPSLVTPLETSQLQGRAEASVNRVNDYLDSHNNPRNLSEADQQKCREDISLSIHGSQKDSALSEYLTSLPSDIDRNNFIDGILKDPSFRLAVAGRLSQVVERRIDASAITTRISEAAAGNPPKTLTQDQARNELQKEYVRDLDNVVMDAFTSIVDKQVEASDPGNRNLQDTLNRAAATATDEEKRTNLKNTSDAVAALEKRWKGKGKKRKGNITSDFRTLVDSGPRDLLLAQKGSDGITPLLNAGQVDAILADPSLKKQIENDVCQSLLSKRLGINKRISPDDIQELLDARWIGATAEDRQTRLTQIIENHPGVNGLVGDLKDRNLVSKDFSVARYATNKFVLAGLFSLLAFPAAGLTVGAVSLALYSIGVAGPIGGIVGGIRENLANRTA